MSRTRIVGGKYTKITGGTHEIYGKRIDYTAQLKVRNDGVQGGVDNTNTPKSPPPPPDTLQVIKVEGPFDDNGNLVEFLAREEEYIFKATTSRDLKKNEVSLLKWEIEYDDSEKYKIIYNGGTILSDGRVGISLNIYQSTTAEKFNLFAYFKKREKNASVCVEIEAGEILMVVGTEQHSQTYGNKLMFPAQAVREIKKNYPKHKHTNIIIFQDAFTPMQLSIIKRDAKRWNNNVYFKQIITIQELIDYINNGDATVNRASSKVGMLKIFSHGLPSVLDFGLDGANEANQRFNIAYVSKLKKESFTKLPIIYSYACRTGNSDARAKASMPGYNYDAESIKLVKPENSLAQTFANHLEGKVYAYLKRSNYTSTWLDGGDKSYTQSYLTIEDEAVSNPLNPRDWFRTGWDEALWNLNGAYLPPKSGTSPGGLLQEGLFVFEKDEKPKKV